MATASATITNLRIDGQALAFTLAVDGNEGDYAEAMMLIYDAAGSERERTDLGTMAAGQSWDAVLDLPAATLDDGDYGAWVFVSVTSADNLGRGTEQGVSFLVGRNHVYPSTEHADKRTFTTPPHSVSAATRGHVDRVRHDQQRNLRCRGAPRVHDRN